MKYRVLAVCGILLSVTAVTGWSDDDAQPAQQRPMPRRIMGNFDNPCGIAIHPETGHIFIAEHRGIYRLHRAPGQNGGQRWQRTVEVTGFPTDVYGKGPEYNIGPLGVAFLDSHHLVVGDGSREDGEELVRIYDIESEPRETPLQEGDADITLGPITASEFTEKGEGNFYGIAISDSAIYITCNGDDTKGWISRALYQDAHNVSELIPFIATKEAVEVDAPIAITLNENGDLVVGQGGEVNIPGDSLLTFYDAESGELKAVYETGLHDITGLAYDLEGRLFAVDFAWVDPSQGGLFELTIDGDYCDARKIMSLDKPTALAFDANGHLFVTVFGTAEEGSDRFPGEVWRIPRARLNDTAE